VSLDPYREKVAEEMLLCEVIIRRICIKHYEKHCLMRVPCSRIEASLHGSCRQTASIFKRICWLLIHATKQHGMVDESIALQRRCTRICEENGPADPVLQGIVSGWRVASKIWWGSGSSERWASVAADNHAHTYAIA
jgi:hypothetical protein